MRPCTNCFCLLLLFIFFPRCGIVKPILIFYLLTRGILLRFSVVTLVLLLTSCSLSLCLCLTHNWFSTKRNWKFTMYTWRRTKVFSSKELLQFLAILKCVENVRIYLWKHTHTDSIIHQMRTVRIRFLLLIHGNYLTDCVQFLSFCFCSLNLKKNSLLCFWTITKHTHNANDSERNVLTDL